MVGASINDTRQEIDDAFADMREFYEMEPDEIIRLCSGHSARLSELRARIQRLAVVLFVVRNPRHRGGISRAVRKKQYVKPLVEGQSHDVVPTRNEKVGSWIPWPTWQAPQRDAVDPQVCLSEA